MALFYGYMNSAVIVACTSFQPLINWDNVLNRRRRCPLQLNGARISAGLETYDCTSSSLCQPETVKARLGRISDG
jgi:hypothetical protein